MIFGTSMDQEICLIQEMKQLSCLEEIRESGSTPKEAKSAELIFEESRTGLSR